MKLSNETLEVLKNFSTINQNVLIKAGNTIATMSAMKNIVAKANVAETFPLEVPIYDLNEFLSSVSLFKSPVFDFQETYVTISEENSRKTSLKYFYSDPSVVTSPSKDIAMPDTDVNFVLDSDVLNNLKKAAAVIGASDLVLEKVADGTLLTVKDKKNATANNYSVDVESTSTASAFGLYFKTENIKLVNDSYDVSVSSKLISQFKSKNKNVTYWIALEPESTYEA